PGGLPHGAHRLRQRDRMAALAVAHARYRRPRSRHGGAADRARRARRSAGGRGACAVSRGWSDAKRILCVRLDNLGDVLMTTPALRALKASAPGRHLTLLASRAGAAAAQYI